MQTQSEPDTQKILDHAECCAVGGGINPQPLPPRAPRTYQIEGNLHSVYVDGLYRGDYYLNF